MCGSIMYHRKSCACRKRSLRRSITHKIPQAEYDTLDAILPETDVLYVTRVQKERFEDLNLYENVKSAFVITPETLKVLKKR